MALHRCSGGSWLDARCGGVHQTRAPTTARLLAALITNGAARPNHPRNRPPRAGPNTRLILMPTLLAATAG